MLDQSLILQAAARLDQAERSREQVRQFSLDHPAITLDDAYAIQRAWVAQKIKDGRKLVGHKIGLTSRAMQVSSNITEPDYGALLDDMFFDEGTDIPFERFIVPRVEVELAFILGKPLKGPNVTVFDVLDATEWVIPALEIIDARIQQVDPTPRRPARCSTPSPTTPPTPAWSWAGGPCAPPRSTCARCRRCSTAMA
jgi:2-oxo-hept-3-ene-1,7-dioate hydratase